ncbi:major outer membrane protein [Arcobacter sp. YIC-464]|uniref:major outer membrane protein n=1 Tax=Arcobacter sp. YIC-464 TaxID=3376631 RepID=UPI003C29F015
MKKIAKLSLVAAVAVAGLSTTSSAASLEEAIKGVDISGQVRYRMEDASQNGAGSEDQDVNIDVKIKVPVTDKVTFVANANFDDDNQETQTAHSGTAAATNGTASDSSGTLDQYYFQYSNGAVTALLGTQDIPGRLTDSEEASGLVALYNAGAFTVGGAAFYNADVSSEAIYSVIAMGNVGPVSLLGQYVDVDNTMKVYNVKADASLGMVKTGVEYSEKELDTGAATDDERSTFKAYVAGNVGIVSASLAYAATGDNGSGSIDEAAETPAEFLLWQMGSAGVSDLSAFAVDATVTLTDKISVRAAYADGEHGTADTDISETLGQINYKVAKNLNTYIRYSELEEQGAQDKQRGRIEVKYTF